MSSEDKTIILDHRYESEPKEIRGGESTDRSLFKGCSWHGFDCCHSLLSYKLRLLSHTSSISQKKIIYRAWSVSTIETDFLSECPSSYRASPEGDGTTFQIFDSGRWWTHNCQTGLVWDQTLCRCEYPPGTRWELDCR